MRVYHLSFIWAEKVISPFHKSPKKSTQRQNVKELQLQPLSTIGIKEEEEAHRVLHAEWIDESVKLARKLGAKWGERVGTWTRKSWAPSTSASTKLLTVTVWTVLVFQCMWAPMWQLGMKKDTHTENTIQEKRMKFGWNYQNLKLVEVKFFWKFRCSISTSAFGNLGFNYLISHSSRSLHTGWGLLLIEFGNLGLATISFYLFSQSMEFNIII